MKNALLLRIACGIFVALVLGSCGESGWTCRIDGEAMYSVNTKTGDLGAANRGCSCDEIRSFERRVFGEVDEDALRRDHGCR